MASCERIAHTRHAYERMRRHRISHGEVERILNGPDITHPSEGGPDRMVARGLADDGRRAGIVYTENHDGEADVLVITVPDFDSVE